MEYIKSFMELSDINKNDLINANEYEGLLYKKYIKIWTILNTFILKI